MTQVLLHPSEGTAIQNLTKISEAYNDFSQYYSR